MKKTLYIVSLLLGLVMISCYNEEIEKINSRLDSIETTQIATINQQITSINNSILLLNSTNKELSAYIAVLEAKAENLQIQITATNTKIGEVKQEILSSLSNEKAAILAELEAFKATVNGELEAIKAVTKELKAKEAAIEGKIADLQRYVDNELTTTEDWVTATFATLEHYNALTSELAVLKTHVYESEISLLKAISSLETSMKEWVNVQLTGFYTIAEIDAKVETLENAYAEGKADIEKDVANLQTDLTTTKEEVTEAYKNAIAEAISTNNGVINTKIATEIEAVNEKISVLENRLDNIENRLSEIEDSVESLEKQMTKIVNRIQSVSYIPQYSDSKASIDKTAKIGTFDFQVSPKDAVADIAKIWDSVLTMQAIHTQTRVVSFIELPIIYFEANTDNGTFYIEVDAANLGEHFFSGEVEASASLHISDGNNDHSSEYVNLVLGSASSKFLGDGTFEFLKSIVEDKLLGEDTPDKSNWVFMQEDFPGIILDVIDDKLHITRIDGAPLTGWPEVLNLPELTWINVFGQAGLEGKELPKEWNSPKLVHARMSRCGMTGLIPAGFASTTPKLVQVFMDQNNFYGVYPHEWAAGINTLEVFIGNNHANKASGSKYYDTKDNSAMGYLVPKQLDVRMNSFDEDGNQNNSAAGYGQGDYTQLKLGGVFEGNFLGYEVGWGQHRADAASAGVDEFTWDISRTLWDSPPGHSNMGYEEKMQAIPGMMMTWDEAAAEAWNKEAKALNASRAFKKLSQISDSIKFANPVDAATKGARLEIISTDDDNYDLDMDANGTLQYRLFLTPNSNGIALIMPKYDMLWSYNSAITTSRSADSKHTYIHVESETSTEGFISYYKVDDPNNSIAVQLQVIYTIK